MRPLTATASEAETDNEDAPDLSGRGHSVLMEHETRFEFIDCTAIDTASLRANWRPRRLRLLRITRCSLTIRPHVGNVMRIVDFVGGFRTIGVYKVRSFLHLSAVRHADISDPRRINLAPKIRCVAVATAQLQNVLERSSVEVQTATTSIDTEKHRCHFR